MTTLRQFRAATGTTLQAIADACDTTRSYIHQIENGHRTPGLRLAVRISAATEGQVSVEELLDPEPTDLRKPQQGRSIRIEGDVAFVPLTKGYEAVIDADDVPLVAGCNWCARVQKNSVYAVRGGDPTKKRTVIMHRLIMGDPEGMQVDHIDCDGLNNRRHNLRIVTAAQNKRNARIRSDNKSGFKGVYWDKTAVKWRAQISLDGKIKRLGLFSTPQEAHAAYCAASAKLHGEFGRTQ